eukprot:4823399-Pleurochrysis_carterae.AAC.1
MPVCVALAISRCWYSFKNNAGRARRSAPLVDVPFVLAQGSKWNLLHVDVPGSFVSCNNNARDGITSPKSRVGSVAIENGNLLTWIWGRWPTPICHNVV